MLYNRAPKVLYDFFINCSKILWEIFILRQNFYLNIISFQRFIEITTNMLLEYNTKISNLKLNIHSLVD